MEDNKVDQVIAALSRIEHSAEKIKSDTEQKKSEYAQEIEDKKKVFDENLEKEHHENMKKLAEKLENEKENSLHLMKADMEEQVGKLVEAYEKNHEKMAEEIFRQLISE